MVTKYIVLAFFLAALVVPVVSQEGCAHVVDGTATEQSPGVWLVAATVSSTETGWDKYADEWIVSTKNKNDEMIVLGTRTLAHPHENEQPFTRSLSGVSIPEDVSTVVLSARDSVLGYCGDTYELSLGGTSEIEATVVTTPSSSGISNNTSSNTTGMSLFNETVANATARPAEN